MRAVVNQSRANLRARPLQAVLVLVTLAAAACLLTVGFTGSAASTGAFDELHDRTNGAHLWASFDERHVTSDQLERAVRAVPGVDGITGVLPSVEVALPGGDLSVFGGLAARPWRDDQVVARPLVVEGRSPAPGERDAVVVDRNAARHFDLEVGQQVVLHAGTGRQSLRIVGFSVSAESCPFPMCTPAYVHLDPTGFHEMAGAASSGQRGLRLGIRLADPSSAAGALRALDQHLPPGALRNAIEHDEIADGVALSFGFQAAFLTAFGIVAAIVAVLLIVISVGGAVQAQTRRIGILKAVGFTRRQLRGIYVLEYLAIALLASVVGTAVAAVLASRLLRSVNEQFGALASPSTLRPAIAASALTVGFVTLAVLLPVRRATRLGAVAAIRSGHEQRPRRAIRLPALPVPAGRAVADLWSTPRRTLLTISALTVSTASLTFSMISLGNADQFARDPQFSLHAHGDLFAIQSGYLDDPVIEAHPAVEAVVRDHHGFFHFPGDPERRQMRIRAGDLEAFGYPLIEGSAPVGADDVLIGFGLSRSKHLDVGDTMRIEVEGVARDVRVSGIIRDFHNFGQMITVTEHFLPSLDRKQPNVPVLVKLRPGANAEAVASDLEAAAGGLLHAEPITANLLPGQVGGIQGITRGLVAVLAILTVLGLLNSLLLSVQERRRDVGLLKSIGMTPGQVASSVALGAFVLAAMALVVGVPAGVVGTRAVIDASMKSVGFGPVRPDIEASRLLLALPTILAIVAVATWLPARRAARVPVIDALRYE